MNFVIFNPNPFSCLNIFLTCHFSHGPGRKADKPSWFPFGCFFQVRRAKKKISVHLAARILGSPIWVRPILRAPVFYSVNRYEFTANRMFFALRDRTFHKDWNGYYYGIAGPILPKLSTISDFRTNAHLVFSTAILIVPHLSHPKKVSLVTMDGILFNHLS